MFPFLLAVEKMMNKGSLSRDEWQLFARVSADLHTDEPQESHAEKPSWVSHYVWEAVDELQLLPLFSDLKRSVAEHSEQWREYFNVSADSR